MASKMVVQQPKAVIMEAAPDQWNSSICECDNFHECKKECKREGGRQY